jgi:pyruvate/2-oxoglutarate dehydrogenase complex dihydrolipoamide acyltransferase (E2) component
MPRTTPLARAVARDLGVDLERVRGTGRAGRITRADVEAAAAAPHPPVGAPHPHPPVGESDRHPPVGGPPAGRAAGPREAGEPLSTAPAPAPATLPLVHLTVAVDAEALLDLEDELGREVGVPDLVVRACAMVLRADPGLDAALGGGPLTVIHLNVDQLRPPIDAPATAVLAFGAVLPEVVATDGGIEVRRRMRLTLSIDNRAVDGATGARFLGRLKAALEQPLQIPT